jgi:hypothetical protein
MKVAEIPGLFLTLNIDERSISLNLVLLHVICNFLLFKMYHIQTFNFFFNLYNFYKALLGHALGKVYSIQLYVIEFASDLLQVGGFLRVLRLPPPIKLTVTI